MRYAIYFAADADDKLMRLGNVWLGRDPFSGEQLAQPELGDIGADRFSELTSSPRRYGFHGTLKAPFFLKTGQTEQGLTAACKDFAAAAAPFEVSGLSVNRLGQFLALTPNRTEPELNAFANACVECFEPYRAPLSASDLERRRLANLSPRQDGYVEQWGYPYVFDEFRFHMTLSNKLEDSSETQILAAAAERHFSPIAGRPMNCRHFGLYVEQERGAPFQVHSIYELTGSSKPQNLAALGASAAPKENL